MRAPSSVSRLVGVRDHHRLADFELARVRLFRAVDHPEERRLPRSVRPDDADDAAARQRNDRFSNSSLSPNPFLSSRRIDDVVAESRRGRIRFRSARSFVSAARSPSPRTSGYAPCSLPDEHAAPCAPTRARAPACVAGRWPSSPRPPGGYASARATTSNSPRTAVRCRGQLEDPLGDVVEEIPVVRDRHDRARETSRGAFPATPRFPRRGGWSARRAAAGRDAPAAPCITRLGVSHRRRAWSRPRQAAGSGARPLPPRSCCRDSTGRGGRSSPAAGACSSSSFSIALSLICLPNFDHDLIESIEDRAIRFTASLHVATHVQ